MRKTWATLMALVGIAVFSPACDSSQYVVITVQGLPAGNNLAVRTYYALDTQPGAGNSAEVTTPIDHFAVKLSGEVRGTFTVNVLAYSPPTAPCPSASGKSSLPLNGGVQQPLFVTLKPTTASCDASQIPVDYPATSKAPLASWGDSPANIWLAGDKGVILRWNGQIFSRVALPPELQTAPPTWRAIDGKGYDYVWFAGDGGVVAHWDGKQLKVVPLTTMSGSMVTPDPAAAPNWVGVSIANKDKDDVLFASSSNYIGHTFQGYTAVGTAAVTMAYKAYPAPVFPETYKAIGVNPTVKFSSVHCMAQHYMTENECWFVGFDSMFGGYMLQAYSYTGDGNYVYSDFSMRNIVPYQAVTQSQLMGVWADINMNQREVFAVGANGTFLANMTPYASTNLSFLAPMTGTTVSLNAVGGTTSADLWIAGAGGTLLQYNPAAMLNQFIPKSFPKPADLSSVFATGGYVYASGNQQTFIGLSEM